MENLLEEIQFLERNLKSKKEILKEVVNKIKEETSERFYSKERDTNFRYAFMLMTDSYCNKYGLGSMLPYNYDIDPAKTWKTNEYKDYYNINKRSYYNNFNYDIEQVGFICYGDNLLKAIEPYLESMWKHIVNENKYKESFQTYINDLKSYNLFQIYALFETYMQSRNKKHLLTIINYKNLKIKDVVIFIENL